MIFEEILGKFCREILDVVDKKVVDPVWFNRKYGLCTNFLNYCDHTNLNRSEHLDFLELFDNSHPFNEDLNEYWKEGEVVAHYSNEKRLAFLRENATKRD